MPWGPQLPGPLFGFGPDLPNPMKDFGPGTERSLEEYDSIRNAAQALDRERSDVAGESTLPGIPSSTVHSTPGHPSACCLASAAKLEEQIRMLQEYAPKFREELDSPQAASMTEQAVGILRRAAIAAREGRLMDEWLACLEYGSVTARLADLLGYPDDATTVRAKIKEVKTALDSPGKLTNHAS